MNAMKNKVRCFLGKKYMSETVSAKEGNCSKPYRNILEVDIVGCRKKAYNEYILTAKLYLKLNQPT